MSLSLYLFKFLQIIEGRAGRGVWRVVLGRIILLSAGQGWGQKHGLEYLEANCPVGNFGPRSDLRQFVLTKQLSPGSHNTNINVSPRLHLCRDSGDGHAQTCKRCLERRVFLSFFQN